MAGAYKREGWQVVLTPARGDKGIDIIATRSDIGQLKFIDQCKAYARNRPVKIEEVREVAGVLLETQT